MQLTRGQNAALATTTLRFTAAGDVGLDVSALVTDTDLKALSSDTFVFYNQQRTSGVHLGEGSVEIDLDAVHPEAGAVLCVVSVDPLAAAGTVVSTLTAALHDHEGRPVATFEIGCRAAETAVICWELYRRAGRWKVRAVGQGYADGLAGLITHHGVDVEDEATSTPARPAAEAGEYGPIEPLDPDHIVERFGMILEDAARSAGAYLAARQFAAARLDRELTAAVSDPATRNTSAATDARSRAQLRHDTVVDDARARHRRDAAHLDTELCTIGPQLPRAFADWNAPSWTTGTPDFAVANGIRVGDLSAPECGPLRVPVCLPFPFRGPLRVEGADTPGTAAVTAAAVLRILAADRRVDVDVVDLSGNLDALATVVARRGGSAIARVDDIGPFLESTATAAELALLDREHPGQARSARRLIVLNHFPFGYDPRSLPVIAFLVEHGSALGVSTVIVTDDDDAVDQIEHGLARRSHLLPAVDTHDWRDPWTSTSWTFTPDRVPSDPVRLVNVLARVTEG